MRKFLCILALMLVCGLPAAAQKNSMKQLESQRAQLEKDITLLNRKLDQNAKNKDAALSNLSLLKSKIRTREKLIDGCDQTIRMLDDSIAVCQRQMNKLQARHDTLSLYYGRLVRGAYKNRDSRLWYMYILSSESIGQGLKRAGYLRSMSAEMSAQALRIRETSAQLEVEKERLNGLRKEATDMRRKVVSERTQLKSEETQANNLVTQLGKDRKKFQKQLQEKNRQKEALNKKIADLIRKESQKAAKSKGFRQQDHVYGRGYQTVQRVRRQPGQTPLAGGRSHRGAVRQTSSPRVHQRGTAAEQRRHPGRTPRRPGQGRLQRQSDPDCGPARL